ncbi:MAG: SpoIIE family protein phosphatase [Phycisphaerales bacterium]|nr:MAG: SpoIIE family protein phosphatase [Phycisphaerales bacterium]
MQVLLVNPPSEFEKGVTEVVDAFGGKVRIATDYQEAIKAAHDTEIDAFVIGQPDEASACPDEWEHFRDLVRFADSERIAALLVGDQPPGKYLDDASLLDSIDHDITLAELRGRLATIQRYHKLLKRVQREIRNMERLGKCLNQHFYAMDQEMRLAARLQRDFLPKLREPILNLRCAAIYRPASWVSGDIYDVFQIDERHVGFYVADAVGHGTAASLLTMFIKRTIVPRTTSGDRDEVCSPSEVLANLNSALVEQQLPNSQFVTAWYGLLDTETLILHHARGGHPYPILLDNDNGSTELRSQGGLLGLHHGEDYPTQTTQLSPGNKLLVFSDGVETVFQHDGREALDVTAYRAAFESVSHLSIEEMLLKIEAALDQEAGSLSPRDDITVLGLQIHESRGDE